MALILCTAALALAGYQLAVALPVNGRSPVVVAVVLLALAVAWGPLVALWP